MDSFVDALNENRVPCCGTGSQASYNELLNASIDLLLNDSVDAFSNEFDPDRRPFHGGIRGIPSASWTF